MSQLVSVSATNKSKYPIRRDKNEYKYTLRKTMKYILTTHKIRSTFHTESILCNLLCKPKDQVDTEDEFDII